MEVVAEGEEWEVVAMAAEGWVEAGSVVEGLAEEVRHETHLAKLRSLLREATLCSSIEHFASNLGK